MSRSFHEIRPDEGCTRAEGVFELKVPINQEIGRRFLGAHGMKVDARERGTVKTDLCDIPPGANVTVGSSTKGQEDVS